jgi:hypothetical protein
VIFDMLTVHGLGIVRHLPALRSPQTGGDEPFSVLRGYGFLEKLSSLGDGSTESPVEPFFFWAIRHSLLGYLEVGASLPEL